MNRNASSFNLNTDMLEDEAVSTQKDVPIEQEIDRTDLFLPIRKAKEKGATDEQVLAAISSKYPSYAQKFETARTQGASDEQIFKALSRKPGFTEAPLRKTGRIATQAAIGVSEAFTLPYNLAAIAAGAIGEGAKGQMFRQDIFDDMTSALEMKAMGIWSDQDQERFDAMQDIIRNPEKAKEFLPDIPQADVGSIIEKGFELGGIDMRPEDLPEKAARWVGFIKDPKKLLSAAKTFYKDPRKVTEVARAVRPSLTEFGRGIGAATGMEIAEEGGFGPIGSIVATILGDIAGGGVAQLPKVGKQIVEAGKEAIADPKKFKQALKEKTAKGVAFLTKRARKDIGDDIARNMEKAGVEADLGTLTNSNVVKVIQNGLEHSGLVGSDLENMRTRITQQFEKEYKKIADNLGEIKFSTIDEAGNAVRDAAKAQNIRFPYVRKVEAPREAQKALGKRIAKKEIPDYVDDFLGTVSHDVTESSRETGKELKHWANRSRDLIKRQFNKEYEEIRKEIADIAAPQPNLVQKLGAFVKENEGTLLKDASPAEKKVIKTAKDLQRELTLGMPSVKMRDKGLARLAQKQLEKEPTKFKSIPLKNLWDTKTTLADITDFEFGGSNFKTKFRYLVGLVDEAIQETLARENAALSQKSARLNKRYSTFKDSFENKHVLPLFEKRGKDFSKIYNSFLNQDSITRLEPVLKETMPGQRLADQMRRDFAEKTLTKKGLTDKDINELQSVFGGERKAGFNRLRKGLEEAKKGIQKAKPKTVITKERPKRLPPRTKKEFKATVAEQQYRNNLANLIKKKTPEQIFNMMNSVEGINTLERLIANTPEGIELMNSLKRLKMEKMIGENMVDSTTQQLKMGTFAKLLEKGKNRDIAKRILGKEGYNDLVFLQKHAGDLAASGQKYYNASRTETKRRDLTTLLTIATGVLTGNPWLAAKVGAGLTGAKKVAGLMADPEFLSMTREAIIAGQKNDTKLLVSLWDKMLQMFAEYKGTIAKGTAGAVIEGK